ncbi:unnamed protein product [Darwinula stevensoni]|uniref:Alcohol dehydrogenase-like C-terminal domain-containing protein n=1 Tax=Darwinula stevensoni TaxID=69355 RepID=A0A7R8WZ59_9CRUS|nr:unnamed protein product [Darwinula stevensoni]CAG0880191.1 unnamed protein product [Darwinula stevensoni]
MRGMRREVQTLFQRKTTLLPHSQRECDRDPRERRLGGIRPGEGIHGPSFALFPSPQNGFVSSRISRFHRSRKTLWISCFGDGSYSEGFLAETLSCVYHGRELVGRLDPDSKILVLGGGIVGMLWAAVLKHEGLRSIALTDVSAFRLNQARNSGFVEEAVEPGSLSGENFDLVVDCCGIPQAVEDALNRTSKGAVIVLFACPPSSVRIRLRLLDMTTKGLRIIGAQVNPFTYGKAVGLLDAMSRSGYVYKRPESFSSPIAKSRWVLTPERFGLKEYKLADFRACLKDLAEGKVTKAVFAVCPQLE